MHKSNKLFEAMHQRNLTMSKQIYINHNDHFNFFPSAITALECTQYMNLLYMGLNEN